MRAGEALPDALDVVVDAVIAKHGELLLDFPRRLAARLHILFDLVFVLGRNDLRLPGDQRD